MKKKSLCIIPARGGSKRIPGKNVKLFRGKPLMTYSIGAAISCGRFENIMVSTEDKKIAEVAEAYGAEVPFLRDPKTANDTAGLAEVLVEVLQCYEKQGVDYTYAACVLATAPLIRPQALAEAFDRLEVLEVAARHTLIVAQLGQVSALTPEQIVELDHFVGRK